MTASSARRLVLGLWIAMAVLWATALVLALLDEPTEAVLVGLVALPAAVYAIVGGLVARRHPGNPIGWIFCAVGLSLVLWVFGLAYAQAGLGGEPGLGPLPGAAAAAWFGTLSALIVVPIALPTFLLYFPDGNLRSRHWRVAVGVAVLGGTLMVLGAIGTAHGFSGTIPLEAPALVAGLPGIGGAFGLGLALVGASAFAGLASLMLRYGSVRHDERQSLRLLVGVIVAMALATALAIVAVPASGGADWSWLLIVLASLVDIFGIYVGIPVATAAAVLTYGLYDVGVVMRKTVVYVVLVIFFVLLLGVVSVVLPLAVGLGALEGGPTREAVIARVLVGIAVFTTLGVSLFRPMRRLARRLVYGRRSTRYEAMAEFSERLGEVYSTEDVLPRMAEIVRASTGAEVARVWLRLGGELRPVAAAPSGAPPVDAVALGPDELPAMDGVRVFPVRDRGELLGALTVAMPPAEPLSKDGEHLVTDLAGQAGLVLRNARLIEELHESRRRIVAAQDERARKLERDIHDGAQQQLVALAVKLRLADSFVGRDDERAHALLSELGTDTNDALETLRDLARGIYPPLLADKGLAEALRAQARKSPMPVQVQSDGVGRYPQAAEGAVYFCVLEALQNAAKYAEASQVSVRLAQRDGRLTFEIQDDGRGFDPAANGHGSGLQGMADRLEALGGSLEVASEPGRGTTISGWIRVEATA
jgi:signal transduction histidine kinase